MGARPSPECSVSKWFMTEVRCRFRMPETSLVQSGKVHGERVVSGVKSVWRERSDEGGGCEGRVGVHRQELEKLLRRNCFRVDEGQD